jgi:hypothetical protein
LAGRSASNDDTATGRCAGIEDLVVRLGLGAPRGLAERRRRKHGRGFTAWVYPELVVAHSHADVITHSRADAQSDVTVTVSMPGRVRMLPKGC